MSPACMNSVTQKSISSLLDDGDALSTLKVSQVSIPKLELSTDIPSVSDQKLSSIWNSSQEEELPVFSNDEVIE